MLLTRLIALLWLLLAATAAGAQTFPPLSGRVVDAANILSPEQESALTAKLAALEQGSGRQFVVATVPGLQGYTIEDYGYRLGRSWGIGTAKLNDGLILLVAPNERKVRIEAGYGLTPIVTDALSGIIIRRAILPRFRDGDMAGGIDAGADALIDLIKLPDAEAAARAQEIVKTEAAKERQFDPAVLIPIVIIGGMMLMTLRSRRRGGVYRRGGGPIILWGPGMGGWGDDDDDRWGGGGGWGGGGWGGGGGFSGGGGSFGGGGASGSW
nr:TPM domain-containing protein [Sphingomonas sp. MM-1]